HLEVVRRLPLPTLWRLESQGQTHAATEPRARIGGLWPDVFVETGEDDEVGRLQAGLQQAPDEDVVAVSFGGAHRLSTHERMKHAVEPGIGKRRPLPRMSGQILGPGGEFVSTDERFCGSSGRGR